MTACGGNKSADDNAAADSDSIVVEETVDTVVADTMTVPAEEVEAPAEKNTSKKTSTKTEVKKEVNNAANTADKSSERRSQRKLPTKQSRWPSRAWTMPRQKPAHGKRNRKSAANSARKRSRETDPFLNKRKRCRLTVWHLLRFYMFY